MGPEPDVQRTNRPRKRKVSEKATPLKRMTTAQRYHHSSLRPLLPITDLDNTKPTEQAAAMKTQRIVELSISITLWPVVCCHRASI